LNQGLDDTISSNDRGCRRRDLPYPGRWAALGVDGISAAAQRSVRWQECVWEPV